MTSKVKSIFIVRHGHADFNTKIDFDRPLNPKGVEAVNKTAMYIKQKCKELQISLDLCICSAAQRTLQTSQIICQENNISSSHSLTELYSSVVSQWLDKVAQVKNKGVLLVGHNPTFSQMVNNLCGYEFYMRPAECALINLEIQPDGIIYPATLIDTYQYE